jgi:hypothetical protein
MQTGGTRYVIDLDKGLIALKKFIKTSFVGDKVYERVLVVDKDYEFTIYTKLPKRLNQRQNDVDEHVVKVPKGASLLFFGESSKSKTITHVFMVNDVVEGKACAWRIDTLTQAVKWSSNSISAKIPPTASGTFSSSFNDNSPRDPSRP